MDKIENVDYDKLPLKMKKKIRKVYEHQATKHPGITELQIMDKIGKKLKIKFTW